MIDLAPVSFAIGVFVGGIFVAALIEYFIMRQDR